MPTERLDERERAGGGYVFAADDVLTGGFNGSMQHHYS